MTRSNTKNDKRETQISSVGYQKMIFKIFVPSRILTPQLGYSRNGNEKQSKSFPLSLEPLGSVSADSP